MLSTTEINNLLSEKSHRPFALPSTQWQYYQEWRNVIFFHWKVPFLSLRKCVPEEFNIDSFNGECYVSIVAFTMQNIRPRSLPAIKFISNFHEINLRTYIDNNNKKGIYFLSIEAEKYLSVVIAKFMSGLPYEKSNIKTSGNNYRSINKTKNFHLNTEFEVGQKLHYKSELDAWLTERYCLYCENNNEPYRYDVHHKEWEIKSADIKNLDLYYQTGDIILFDLPPDSVHYSEGVKVLAWRKQRI